MREPALIDKSCPSKCQAMWEFVLLRDSLPSREASPIYLLRVWEGKNQVMSWLLQILLSLLNVCGLQCLPFSAGSMCLHNKILLSANDWSDLQQYIQRQQNQRWNNLILDREMTRRKSRDTSYEILEACWPLEETSADIVSCIVYSMSESGAHIWRWHLWRFSRK